MNATTNPGTRPGRLIVPRLANNRMGYEISAGDILRQLSQKFKVAVIVEGSPDTVPSEKINFNDLRSSLQSFGERNGYDVHEYRSVYYLRRRYERASIGELPAISVGEIRQSLKDIRSLVNLFTAPKNPKIIDLKTFIDEAKGPLLDRLQVAPMPLLSLPEKWQTLLSKHFYGTSVFSCQRTFAGAGDLLDAWPDLKLFDIRDFQGNAQVVVGRTSPSAEVTMRQPSTQKVLANCFAGSIPLKNAAALLSKTSSGPVTVEESLIHKPVWAAGEEFVSGDAGIQALVQLCGLTLHRLPTGRRIERNRPNAPTEFVDVPQAILAALPDSLKRYLQPTVKSQYNGINPSGNTGVGDPTERAFNLVSESTVTALNILRLISKRALPQILDTKTDYENLRLFLALYAPFTITANAFKPPSLYRYKPSEVYIDVKFKDKNGSTSAEVTLRVDGGRSHGLSGAEILNIKR